MRRGPASSSPLDHCIARTRTYPTPPTKISAGTAHITKMMGMISSLLNTLNNGGGGCEVPILSRQVTTNSGTIGNLQALVSEGELRFARFTTQIC
jgi:hypothetical protein